MTFKLGFWDIEMAPAVAHVWGMFDQNVGIPQVIAAPYMLSFAWRWYGSKTVHFYSVHHNGREEMVKALYEFMNEADAIVSWNGAGFDTPHANREFKALGMTPPSTPKEIDLMRTARSQFRFLSNKLDWVAQYLGIGKKNPTGGHQLWVDCMNGDEAAWRKMRTYNKQDVNLLVEIYEHFKPWIKNHPNLNLYVEGDGCPNCHSENFQKRGFARTGVSKFQQYQCMDCGKWFKDKHSLETSNYRQS